MKYVEKNAASPVCCVNVTFQEPNIPPRKSGVEDGFYFSACENFHSLAWSPSPHRALNAVRNLSNASGRPEQLGLKWCVALSI